MSQLTEGTLLSIPLEAPGQSIVVLVLGRRPVDTGGEERYDLLVFNDGTGRTFLHDWSAALVLDMLCVPQVTVLRRGTCR